MSSKMFSIFCTISQFSEGNTGEWDRKSILRSTISPVKHSYSVAFLSALILVEFMTKKLNEELLPHETALNY